MRLFLILFLSAVTTYAQTLKQVKSTVQTINHGASPTSSTNYLILLKKDKKFIWSIDSIYSLADNKKIQYNIVKLDNPEATSPNYTPIASFEKKYKGFLQITFGTIKSRGDGGKPNAPKIEMTEQNDLSKGVVIYCTLKGKKTEIKIETFQELEKVDAP